MIVEFMDSVTGTQVYINLDYEVSLRPDTANPTTVTLLKLNDGASIRGHGDHQKVADKLAVPP